MIPTAYVDESEPDQQVDPGTYMLACALVAEDVAEQTRDGLRALLRPGQNKVHWNTDLDRREQLSKHVAATTAQHLLIVRTAVQESSERRRRLCLRRLLYELQERGVEQVRLEARQARQNSADRDLLGKLRAQRVISGELRMDHPPGPSEPLLWLADIVAGAYGTYRREAPGLFGPLQHCVEVIEC